MEASDSLRQKKNKIFFVLYLTHPHTFRHTFCTRMAENGMDIKVLQEIMGHKTIAVTMQVYNHALFERKQSEVARIPSALAV